MRLLFDEHLSPKLVRRLGDLYPGSLHVQDLGLRGRKDRSIWEFARDGGFTVVSRDSDFEHLAITLGPPPKVMIVRSRDGHTAVVEDLLRRNAESILNFDRSQEASLLILE
jgi:predicted nuclease of predicted toxin-antitoxin system